MSPMTSWLLIVTVMVLTVSVWMLARAIHRHVHRDDGKLTDEQLRRILDQQKGEL